MKAKYISPAAIILLLILFPGNIYCDDIQNSRSLQDSTSYVIGGAIGFADFHQKDEYLTPYVYRGTIFSSALFFRLNKGSLIHKVDMRFSVGKPSVSLQMRELVEKSGYLSYSFLYNIANHVFLGAGISSFAANTDFTASAPASSTKIHDQSWYWSHSVNIVSEGEYSLSDNLAVHAGLTLPVFSILARPENGHWLSGRNMDVMKDSFLNASTQGKAEWLWNTFAFQFELGCIQRLSPDFDLHADYVFQYASSDHPLSMGMYLNHLLIGIGWKF